MLQVENGENFLKVFNMNVFVDYTVTPDPWGGINTFFKNFKKYATEMPGITLVGNYERADVILFGANTRGKKKRISIEDIKKYGRSKAIVVHRMDGFRQGFGTFVKETMSSVDGYVLQSNNCLEDYSFLKKKSYSLIRNGVDYDIFNWKDTFSWNDSQKLKLLMVSWSTSLDKGFREFAQLSKFTDVECTFVGRWNESVCTENVKLISAVGNGQLPQLYTQHDVFVFPVKRDPCSNVVVEALASTLPVVYYASSGVEDIVGEEYGIPVNSFNDYTEIYRALGQKYDTLISNLIRDKAEFSMCKTVEAYVRFFYELKLG